MDSYASKNGKWAAAYYNKEDIHYLDRVLFCKALKKG
jgi:hypothetical protein